ncbi:MAG: histidine kinase [Acidobacteriota bacterium]|nr:histidine kinase [Acidobacteriota bacterium]
MDFIHPAWTPQFAARVPLIVLFIAPVAATLIVLVHAAIRRYEARVRTEIVSAERERIAREFHDLLGQGLTGVLLHADAGLQSGDLTSARDALRFIKRLTRETLVESKRALFELRDMSENGGVVQWLRRMLSTLTEGLPVTADLSVDGEPRALAKPGADLHLFRVAQEAVTNALRHSRATRIEVTLRFQPKKVILVIRDDGRGSGAFRRDELAVASAGFRGMRERAAEMGALLSIVNDPAGGVEIIVEVDA